MAVDFAIRIVARDEVDAVVPLLMLAEPSRLALEYSLDHLSDTVYRLDVGGRLVGAATLRWDDEPCEIMELGIAVDAQGRGHGRRFVEWLIEEGKRRHKKAMIVGTRNSSIGNFAFYQKCGFRIDHVRADYFWYYRGTEVENGIPVRDLVVFRYDFVPASKRRRRPG